jgi:inosine/xanthosine triphosphatase
MKIIVASGNQAKIDAAVYGFKKIFPSEVINVQGISSESGVKDNPTSSAETLLGATNRVEYIFKKIVDADYWIGIEGGIEKQSESETENFAWVVIKSKNGITGKAKTATYYFPKKIVKLLNEGKTLGEADSIVFSRDEESKLFGTINALTNKATNRTEYYGFATMLALIPIINN